MSDEQKPDEPFDARAERERDLPANYGGATLEEVALAVLRYRPGKKKQTCQKAKPTGNANEARQSRSQRRSN